MVLIRRGIPGRPHELGHLGLSGPKIEAFVIFKSPDAGKVPSVHKTRRPISVVAVETDDWRASCLSRGKRFAEFWPNGWATVPDTAWNGRLVDITSAKGCEKKT